MTALREFRCEVCPRITNKPTHWFVIQWSDVAPCAQKAHVREAIFQEG